MSLQNAWYSKQKWVWILAPFTFLFWCISSLRRAAFKLGLKRIKHSRLPVIIVGNISVGGNGKTPVTLALVEYLQSQGHIPAVLSRGYGGTQTTFPHLLTEHCEPIIVGDEPALMAKRLNCPIVIDPKRARGSEFIEQHTNATVIICDDGLQHYALARSIELCVLDKRGVGNGYLLPMGPLREGAWRLNSVDACILNANEDESALTSNLSLVSSPVFSMALKATKWVNVSTNEQMSINAFSLAGKNVAALAGIGDPKRFFSTLHNLGIVPNKEIALPDHHHFQASDIPSGYTVLMTEKDAIKCANIAHSDCWYLQVNAILPATFYAFLQTKLTKQTYK